MRVREKSSRQGDGGCVKANVRGNVHGDDSSGEIIRGHHSIFGF